eukprot:gene19513-biopygen42552
MQGGATSSPDQDSDGATRACAAERCNEPTKRDADVGGARPVGGVHPRPRRARGATRAGVRVLLCALVVAWQVGYAGVRVGEAANPGHAPWKVTTANVTALTERTRIPLSTIGGSIVALQEVKLTKVGQEAATKRLWHEGWQTTWGKAQPPGTRAGGADQLHAAASSGVGVLVRCGLPMQAGPVDNPLRKRLWASGRWVHCIFGLGDGAQALHVMSVYGHCGAREHGKEHELNEQLLADVLEAAAEMGNVPMLIMGDLNTTLEESATLREALVTGAWEDLALAQAEAVAAEPESTCFPDNTDKTSRIDIVLGNAAALAATRGVSVLKDTGLWMHRPVRVELDMAVYKQRVRAVHKPAAFPTEDWEQWEEEACEAAGAAAAEA